MRKHIELLYWSAMVVAMSLILMSIMGSFGAAFFLSVMLLPGVLFVKYFSKDISFKNRKMGILHSIYFILIALLIEYLAILFVYWFLYGYKLPEYSELILNPFFIWFLLAAMLSFEKLLKMKCFTSAPEEQYITFTSERKKVSIELDSITYIESKDYEVWVMTDSETSYPTRMKISQWEAVLDSRFLRVHRSFIVNRKQITRFDARAVYIRDLPIEISRKYKESVGDRLNQVY